MFGGNTMAQSLLNFSIPKTLIQSHSLHSFKTPKLNPRRCFFLRCAASSPDGSKTLRTCKNCKTQFDPLLNHPRACRFHTAHFAGETKRKFESVYTGGTMDTPNSGKVLQYWHCCGSEDPFDSGCTASPHATYDD
ncbi:PREDICTED: uncharacterized protein LOC104724159 [Camelina sativa]|uniref:Uncharacterized protein LOC104724159 n=1 Tax=Camelina sativa TaxID=90675 RepID=A0ABM0UGR4_CAMSA|nr:PREDICTED: uncharacterized protein LOC104724159 [Camelina sativa]